MRLSERLAKECDRSSANGFAHSTEVRLLLAEASELAKRYEDAPSGELLEVMERSSIINWGHDAPIHFYGQRVRIVLDKEG